MSQTPVTGIRMDASMANRFAKAVEASESQKPADVHRALLNLGLRAVEAEKYDFDRALLRTMVGLPADSVLAIAAQSHTSTASSKPLESLPNPRAQNKRQV